jgi:proton glutamate symport protein
MLRMALHWQILIGMLIGAAVGVVLNKGYGERETTLVRADQRTKDVAKAVWNDVQSATFVDTPNTIEITITDLAGKTRKVTVDPSGKNPDSVPTLGKVKEKDPAAYALFEAYGRSTSRYLGDWSSRIGKLFLRMLQMVAVPLIITSLITGVMGLGHAERLRSMFGRTLVYYVATSMLAITTGLAMVNLIQPGQRSEASQAAQEKPNVEEKDLGETLFEQVETMIPLNPIRAVADAKFLSIISFSLAFAIFALLVGGRTAELIGDLFRSAFEVMMAMTMAIIRLAPLGVLFLLLGVVATQGTEVFGSLGLYMVTVFAALLFHAAVTLPLILWFIARRNPLHYVKALSPALLTAFGSASSNATLPLTMTCVEQRAGVSNRVSSFVLPLGATINMDGTALYEVVAVLFIAQLHPDFDLTFADQIIVAFTALLASIGAAGIPHAGLVMMVIVLQAVGLPVEMQGIIIAVDRVLDMCRTSVNVWSDSCGCAVVARFESGDGTVAELAQEGAVDI